MKLQFIGVNKNFWFLEIISNAEKNLKIGQIYTLNKTHVASSWTAITLVETGELEYNLMWFKEIK